MSDKGKGFLDKTFNSFWNKNNTALIKSNLINKKQFPLDWARGISREDWAELKVNFFINGYITLSKNEYLVIEVGKVSIHLSVSKWRAFT